MEPAVTLASSKDTKLKGSSLASTPRSTDWKIIPDDEKDKGVGDIEDLGYLGRNNYQADDVRNAPGPFKVTKSRVSESRRVRLLTKEGGEVFYYSVRKTAALDLQEKNTRGTETKAAMVAAMRASLQTLQPSSASGRWTL